MTAQVVQLPRPKIKPLAPLHDRKTRVLLLAHSYHDACERSIHHRAGELGIGHGEQHRREGKPGSRHLDRGNSSALWKTGSYPDLEHCLDELRQTHRVLYGRFWRHHINGRRLETPGEQRDAHHALLWITKRMPPTIYVPTDVSENAGYLPGEAKAFAMPRKRAS